MLWSMKRFYLFVSQLIPPVKKEWFIFYFKPFILSEILYVYYKDW